MRGGYAGVGEDGVTRILNLSPPILYFMLLKIMVVQKHQGGVRDDVVDDELESEHDRLKVYVHVFRILKQEVNPTMISH